MELLSCSGAVGGLLEEGVEDAGGFGFDHFDHLEG